MPLDGGAGVTVDWTAPVGAWMSTRAGGVSRGPYAGLNLGVAVGDDAAAVQENRWRLAAAMGARPTWLWQVHGAGVVRLPSPEITPEADAAWTDMPGIACVVQVADCLPVLLSRRDGRAVAAAHAGWRGLAAGVVEAALAALCDGSGAAPGDIVAWLGPCIGPTQFEVGAEVVEAFGGGTRFRPRPRPDGAERWLADLPGLAHDRLVRAGVGQISGGGWCTVSDASRFFSFRRDGAATGRMAAAVWRLP